MVKVHVEDVGAVKKRVEVSIPEDRVVHVRNQVIRELNRRAKIPGFRPGKIPPSLLERYYSHDIETEMTSRLVSETLEEALKSHGIEAVTTPTLEKSETISEDGFGFRYGFSVEVMPHVEPRDYIGLPASRPEWEIPPEKIEEEVARLRDQHALLRTLDEERPIQTGDLAVIDIEGKIDGRGFDGGKSENLLVEVGSGHLLPGLEEGLVGLLPHSTGEITVTFPLDFRQSQLAGKAAVFNVHVKELKEKVLPALDDEFAREVGGFDSLQQLRDKILENIRQQLERVAKDEVNEAILAKLRSIHPVEVPPSLVEDEGKLIFRNLKARLASQGLDVNKTAAEDHEIMAKCLEEGRKRVHDRLVLQAIGEKEGVAVTEEEVNEEILKLARGSSTTVERLKKDLQENRAMENLRARILEDKTLDFLREKATITIENKVLGADSKTHA